MTTICGVGSAALAASPVTLCPQAIKLKTIIIDKIKTRIALFPAMRLAHWKCMKNTALPLRTRTAQP